MDYLPASPGSSDLSDPPSVESDENGTPGRRDSTTHLPPRKRRKTAPNAPSTLDRAPSSQPAEDDDIISVSSDDWSEGPGGDDGDEYGLRDQAQVQCLWRDCDFGVANNNDDLVRHVQGTHCATGGPKKTKYVCEWGECQRKPSNHPSGYALKAHMRSHTKEKPYYCALPECDKAFTRSDALAKHMRTVHEPEPTKGTAAKEETPHTGKRGAKLKLTNGNSKSAPAAQDPGPAYDEDGNEIDHSPANDNITYVPAHHPITGQPGFMIHYPPDIHFTSFESGIPADQLRRLIRRQRNWPEKESAELKKKIAELERIRREEWTMKDILFEGFMEAELGTAEQLNALRNVKDEVRETMAKDAELAKRFAWTGGEEPSWRKVGFGRRDHAMEDAPGTPSGQQNDGTPSPPPTGASGGFEGDAEPFDNYVANMESIFKERQRKRDEDRKQHQSAEEDAMVGLSGSK